MRACDFSDPGDDGRECWEDQPDDESEESCGLCRSAPVAASGGEFERRLAVCLDCAVYTLMSIAGQAIAAAPDKEAALRRAYRNLLTGYELASGESAAKFAAEFAARLKQRRPPGKPDAG
jgi:hypothetical protein